MHAAIRPYATGGIALVGASVIAVSPIAPQLPDIHLPNPARVAASVELAAATLAATPPSYAQVLQEAVANAQALLKTIAANPTPILSQVAANQAITFQNLMTALQTLGGATSTALTTTVPPLLQAASNDLASGNVAGAINNVLNAILAPVFPITGFIPAVSAAFTQPLTNLVAAINAVQAGGVTSPLAMAVTGLLGPVLSGAGAFGVAVDNVGSAITAGDPQAALNAVVNGPATILDGVLNGGFGPDLSSLAGLGGLGITVVAGGLLSGGLAVTGTSPVTIQLPGTINSLEALATAFAKALTPPKVTAMAALTSSTLAAPAALPAAASKAVTLSTAPTVKVAAPAGDTANTTKADTAAATKGDTADATKGNTAESTTGKTDDTSSDTGASAGTSAKPGTPTSSPKHRAPTGNGANSTAAGSHDQGTKGSTGSHSTATKAAKHRK
jgi:hypothetical protein